jgi:alkyldihydroxyacetonephosphate synthase
MDTFESAITWDRFESFYQSVRQEVQAVIHRMTGQKTIISCRITHAYPDGVAPYFTIAVLGSPSADVASALAAWREIKLAANAAVVGHGGTVTHHHAVGRDHRSGYEVEVPGLFRQMLAGAKAVVDPAGILNPGVLYDARKQPVANDSE